MKNELLKTFWSLVGQLKEFVLPFLTELQACWLKVCENTKDAASSAQTCCESFCQCLGKVWHTLHSVSLSHHMIVLFAILGVLILIISLLCNTKRRAFQKSSVICFLLMAGFCANTELCWIVIAVLLVVMLLKFDAITTWIEALGKDDSERTKSKKR